jgi:ABC-type transport system involved in cytochrome bd biosynthesis fused ATPase/permease subunit
MPLAGLCAFFVRHFPCLAEIFLTEKNIGFIILTYIRLIPLCMSLIYIAVNNYDFQKNRYKLQNKKI